MGKDYTNRGGDRLICIRVIFIFGQTSGRDFFFVGQIDSHFGLGNA